MKYAAPRVGNNKQGLDLFNVQLPITNEQRMLTGSR
ncbi:MAG: hypothetical protein ACI9V1_000634 [Spirosomataceae bacterium]|jgi:hypothetical protein